MAKIVNDKKSPVNDKLKIQLEKIVKKLIAKEHREEALSILLLTDKLRLGEFLYYYYSDIGNVACMVLDYVKIDLVAKKKLKQKKTDCFG